MRHDTTIAFRFAAAVALAASLAAPSGCGPASPPVVPAPRPPIDQPLGDPEARIYVRLEDRCLAEQGPPCGRSEELRAAALGLAEALVRSGAPAIEDPEFVRSELVRAGIGHPNVTAAAMTWTGAMPEDAELAAFVAGITWPFPVREFGVAHADGDPASGARSAIVALGMERLVDIDPPPRWLPQAAAVTFQARLLPGWSNPSAFLSAPDGAVHDVGIRADGTGALVGALPVGAASGRWVFELMAERGESGPAVVYLLPIERSATPPERGTPEVEPAAPGTTDPAAAAEALAALVDAFRADRGLATLERSAALEAAAQAHADDMAANGFFGHVSPTHGDLADRLRTARIPAPRAAENLAIGPSAESAFASLIESPAHRANFLDPQLSRMGVACSGSPGSLVFAVVMAAGW